VVDSDATDQGAARPRGDPNHRPIDHILITSILNGLVASTLAYGCGAVLRVHF
jgi:hypothetical protein